MGDSTLLYGLLGFRSPQPVLYFQPSHSFLEKDIPGLDERVLASLERNAVHFIVRERIDFFGDVLALFPRVSAWRAWQFDHVTDFGNYEIWERKSGGTP